MLSSIRTLRERLELTWKRGKSILLLGPRQTGKTTLAKTFDFDLEVQLLSSAIRREYELNPDLILKEVAALRLKRPARVFVDEIQKVPRLMDSIQLLVDEKKAVFFITGSSARKLKQQADINLLPGRVISYRLDGLSLEEVNAVETDLESLLYYGQLPEIVFLKTTSEKSELLASYVETYLEEEIRKEAGLKKLPDFYRFLQHAASRGSGVISYSGIAQDIGISHTTVKSYYEILASTLVAERIEPIVQSKTRKKLIRSPRYLFFDLGVQRVAAKESAPLPKSILGNYFESWVGLEILKLIRSQRLETGLHFWQDPQSAEVDWVVQKNQAFLPIEVKLSTQIKPADIRHLKHFMNEYPCPQGGVVVFTGSKKQLIDDDILAVPWNQLHREIEKFSKKK